MGRLFLTSWVTDNMQNSNFSFVFLVIQKSGLKDTALLIIQYFRKSHKSKLYNLIQVLH